jgi:hypothetical protein
MTVSAASRPEVHLHSNLLGLSLFDEGGLYLNATGF